MKKKLIILLLTIFCFTELIEAQKIWKLEDCIQHAQKNNISLKIAEYAVKNNELNLAENKYSRYPNLGGNTGGGFQLGKTIDPTTNSFDNQTIGYNSFSINSSVPIYQGGRTKYSIEQSEINIKASQADLEYSANVISLNIATAYLQILLAEDQLQNAEKQLEQTQQQLNQTDKLIKVGSLPKSDRLSILAQLAKNEQTIIEIKNAVETSYLKLKQFLELDPTIELQIEHPKIQIPENDDPVSLSYEATYSQALNTQPQIRASELRIKSADLSSNIARSYRLPSVTLYGNLKSNWSSVSKKIDGYTTETFEQDVLINGEPASIGQLILKPNLTGKPYFDQVLDNFGQGFGISINIPIYNNHRTIIGMERAALNVLNSKATAIQTKQQLSTEIQKAIADAKASKKAFDAAKKTLEASQAAYENAEKRFELGAISTFELTTAKNTLSVAQIDITGAKYQYLFNIKVIEFYQGKPLKL